MVARALLTLFAFTLVSLLPGTARAEGRSLASVHGDWSSLFSQLSEDVRKGMVVEVPLVRREGVRVGLVNHEALASAGLATDPHFGRSKQGAEAILDAAAFRPATPEEIASHPDRIVLKAYATRYADEFDWVRGDGRVVTLGEVLLRDAKSGDFRGSFQVQLKGVPTGLAPKGEGAGSHHGHGKLQLWKGMVDVLKTQYLQVNDVPTERWLALLLTEDRFDQVETKGGKERWYRGLREALLVRGGDFLRLAHLWHFRDDPKALAQLLGHLERQVRARLGAKKKLSPEQLLDGVIELKAAQLAASYWARMGQGLFTFDNDAFFQKIDTFDWVGVDRLHPRANAVGRGVGFAEEPSSIVDLNVRVLGELIGKTLSPAQRLRFELSRVRAQGRAATALERAMGEQVLMHLGFDSAEARSLAQSYGDAARQLTRTVRQVGERAELGATFTQGDGGTIKDPAAYDIFAALGEIASAYGSGDPRQLRAALRPVRPNPTLDLTAARRLLEDARPLLDAATAGMKGDERGAKIDLLAEQAAAINAPVNHQQGFIKQTARRLAEKLEARKDRAVESIVAIYGRENTRKGNRSPAGRAVLLREGALPITAEGKVVLSSLLESGVEIQELSDGTKDTVRVRLTGPVLDAPGPQKDLRIRYTFDGKKWQQSAPSATGTAAVRFDIDLAPGQRPERFELHVTSVSSPKWRWNNYGQHFGRGHRLALSSMLVDAELALWAEARGKKRAQTPRARVEAARRIPRPRRR